MHSAVLCIEHCVLLSQKNPLVSMTVKRTHKTQGMVALALLLQRLQVMASRRSLADPKYARNSTHLNSMLLLLLLLLLQLQVKASRRSLADPKYAQIHARYRKQLIEVSPAPGEDSR
jgi:cytochrome b561